MSDQQLQPRPPYAISEPRFSVSPQMVTTAFELPGFRVRQSLGVVRGIVVRSRNLFVNIGAFFNTWSAATSPPGRTSASPRAATPSRS